MSNDTMPGRDPGDVLETYRLLPGKDISAIGLFDKAVTVLSPQARALNLTRALIETGSRQANASGRHPRLAVIGRI